MKKFTHAWLAFEAIKRLETTGMSDTNRVFANDLIRWFKNHKDGVIRGSWYPDSVIKDMSNSHVLKHTPSDTANNAFGMLPTTYINYQYGNNSPLRQKSFTVDKDDNLPNRCEAIAHSVIDHLKIQEEEDKGSPVSPTDNQVALLLFMLSHYVADAHMPFHCDSRRFSEGMDFHGYIEGLWDDMIRVHYQLDDDNERFFYDPNGYPLRNMGNDPAYQASFLRETNDRLNSRRFTISWGEENSNVLDFMSDLCQYSYLLSYRFIDQQYDYNDITPGNWQSRISIPFDRLSVAVFTDAIDSIARVWFRVWRRYLRWLNG